jgi:hypothetical protein
VHAWCLITLVSTRVFRTSPVAIPFLQRLYGEMADGPNPFDAKYAPGAEQARQDVMVGVSVAMTLIGGEHRLTAHW